MLQAMLRQDVRMRNISGIKILLYYLRTDLIMTSLSLQNQFIFGQQY